MHLLQSGVDLIYIRDLLGHVDIKTTEIYARIDSEMKRKSLEKSMKYILKRMYYQLNAISPEVNPQVIHLLKQYKESVNFENEDLITEIRNEVNTFMENFPLYEAVSVS